MEFGARRAEIKGALTSGGAAVTSEVDVLYLGLRREACVDERNHRSLALGPSIKGRKRVPVEQPDAVFTAVL